VLLAQVLPYINFVDWFSSNTYGDISFLFPTTFLNKEKIFFAAHVSGGFFFSSECKHPSAAKLTHELHVGLLCVTKSHMHTL